MVTPLKSLRLPIGHPLVEILCKLSLKDKPAFNEKSPINFKKEVSEEDKIKFKQAMRVLQKSFLIAMWMWILKRLKM